MRVAIDGRVIDDYFPGIGRYTYHLTEALSRVSPEAEFTLLVLPPELRGQPPDEARLDPSGLPRSDRLHAAAVRAPVFGPSTQWRVPRALRQSGAALFHATYWLTAYVPGLPTVLSVYDLIGLRQRRAVPAGKRLALRLTLRLALRTARQVLTLSEDARRDLERILGLPRERITVTPLAADPRFRPTPPADRAVLGSRLGLDMDAPFVLYVGSNKPHKNLPLLLAAWRERQRAGAAGKERLILAGHRDPRYGPRAGALPPGVIDLGPVAESDLPTLYGAATLFAFPSRQEGFGLPALEAMACGTPVVAANVSSLPEVVGDAGLLVGPDDVSGWARAIGLLLDDPSRAATLAHAGLERASAYTWERTAELTLGAYERALAAR